MATHAVVVEVGIVILTALVLCRFALKELEEIHWGVRKMIGFRDDGFESIRTKLRMMSEVELLRFGREARQKYEETRNRDKSWKELQLAREECRSRHPKRL